MDADDAAENSPRCRQERYKILHLVRHAQGIHNVEVEKNWEAALSPQLFDAQLSPVGWQQVGEQRKQVRDSGIFERIELVITSPMLRTMQTAVGIFGGDIHSDELGSPQETSTVNSLPILAVELCRERTGVRPCDKRGCISNYRSLFPTVDFSLIESDNDELWKAETRESKEQVAARGMQFLKWLWTRKEREIAVVSHGIFLQETLLTLKTKHNASVQTELHARFSNCELRSVTIVEEGNGIVYVEESSRWKVPSTH